MVRLLNKELMNILQQYQANKQKCMNQSRKKHETSRMLAAIRQPQKCVSVPSFKKVHVL